MILKDINRYFNQKPNFLIKEYVKEIVTFIYLRKFSQLLQKEMRYESEPEERRLSDSGVVRWVYK